MTKLRMQSEVDRFYHKVNRNSFSVLWSEDLDLETINQRRFELLTNKRKRTRFCQLAFTPVQHELSYEPLDSSILAMSRLLFGRVYNTYAPDIDEIEWTKEMAQEFNVTKQYLGLDEAMELLYQFEDQMRVPTSLVFLHDSEEVEY